MAGYYENPEATADAFTADGWVRTKYLGYIDSKGWVSIRGRLNSMIVGASGENIYPEEIETVINSHELVTESLVTSSKGVLVAKVCLNPDKVETIGKIKKDHFESLHTKKLQLMDRSENKEADRMAEYGPQLDEWKAEYDKQRREGYK